MVLRAVIHPQKEKEEAVTQEAMHDASIGDIMKKNIKFDLLSWQLVYIGGGEF